MKTTIHRAQDRGVAEHGWLHSRFSFSFADYHNPKRMGFGALRVINDDIIEPGQGFGMHPHQNMEIITIVTQGSVEHQDSEGNRGITKTGEIQYMSAGSGIYHSEFNPSDNETLALFQIWIKPNQKGGKPVYAKKDFNDFTHNNQWVTLVSQEGVDDSMPIKQDARILTTFLETGKTIPVEKPNEGHGYLLFVVQGQITVLAEVLHSRDEIQIENCETFIISSQKDSKIILFDIPLKQI